jgi:hypothetical protein
MEKVNQKKFKNFDLLNGDYSLFTSAEVAKLLDDSLLNMKQKALYFKPFVEYFNEKDYQSMIKMFIKYGEDKVDLVDLELFIKEEKVKVGEEKIKEIDEEIKRLEEKKKEYGGLFDENEKKKK